ncbi:DUF6039 family protein [Acidobacteria bacterium AH-259-L09]|nr:DUF6039 family protein [Acidobacteria bacterium AH-259-L09]
MITWVRTASIQDGEMQEAFAWAVKVASYVNKNISEANVQVMRNVGGPVYQLHWVCNYESLAAFEEVMKKVEEDSGYQELLTEVRQEKAFVGTSIVDSLYETVS